MVENTSGYIFARIVDDKAFRGIYDQKVQMVVNFLDDLGKKEVTIQCDGESTLKSLIDAVVDRYTPAEGQPAIQINARYTAPHSSNSNGSVERAIRLLRDQTRVMFGYITHKFGIIFEPSSRIIPWLIRHVAWLLNRLVMQKSLEGHTRYEAAYGRSYNKNSLYEFLSPVIVVPNERKKSKYTMKMYKAQPKGLFLGRFENGDEHLVLVDDGSIKQAHSVRPIHFHCI